ncbi:O-antigen translocase [Variovorax paradoxus]|jgi:O-antigen/teichoic acid export membrane protein|uniref:O-antigen translocase n=1 Tax=Variovorax paradoxus TaxID=34073 RepID=UPI001ABD2B8A
MTHAGYRGILRSTSIIGGASIVNILIGLIRVKVAATFLGPAGIGLIGLMTNLIGVASNVAALGLGTVGTKQIAEAAASKVPDDLQASRRILFWATTLSALLGGAIFWVIRDIVANHILAGALSADQVGWLSIGVTLTVIAGSQVALLNGLRRIGDLARQSVYSAALGTATACLALYFWRVDAVIVFVLLPLAFSCFFGFTYTRKIPRTATSQALHWREAIEKMSPIFRLGLAIMFAGLAMTVGQLCVRTIIQRQLGVEALGLFESSWMISMTYIGFVLKAMGTDYYPRLTKDISNSKTTNRVVNEQTEVALLLAAPVFLAMFTMSPWVIQLLYSERFLGAVGILRWQIIGDLLKVLSWPLGYVLLAAGKGRLFMLCETTVVLVFVLSSWVAIPLIGLQGAGVGFLLMYVVLLPLVHFLVKTKTNFHWEKFVFFYALSICCAFLSIYVLSLWNQPVSNAWGGVLTIGFSLFGVHRLSTLAGFSKYGNSRVAKISSKLMKSAIEKYEIAKKGFKK